MGKNLLSVQGLRTYFYTLSGIVRAVDGANLRIDEKETVGLVGESGCGKSTIAFSITRLVRTPGKIIDGQIVFKGKNLLELKAKEMQSIRGEEISMIFQDPATYLNPVMKIGNQIGEVFWLNRSAKMRREEVKKKVIDALRTVHLPSQSELARYYPFQLSGGMMQRVMISMAISSRPSLLIADEPTTALDVTIQQQILDLLKELKNELGLSLLLITHNMGIVADICDRVYVMYAGKIVEGADVFSLYRNPKHPYTMGLLKSAMSINEYKEKIETIAGDVPDLVNPPKGCRFHPRCTYTKPTCHEKEPRNKEVERGHTVSCWLYS